MRTLPAALVPVFVGTALAWWRLAGSRPYAHIDSSHLVHWDRAALAALVALGLQVGTNFANDYSDGVRGTDENRVGPTRLVASGLASPRAVRRAALVSFAFSGICGVLLASMSSWWLLAPGVASVAAGWLYTGGPKPYGYLGLGELFVFVFFGVVATVGTVYVQLLRIDASSIVASVPVGLLATALLEANNLRDRPRDVFAGKMTLAVRLGRRAAGWLYGGSIIGALGGIAWISIDRPLCAIAALGLAVVFPAFQAALGRGEGQALLPMLKWTARAQLSVGALLIVGFLS